MFTDTDSLVYEIETNNVCEDFYEDRSLFDFSDYPENSKFFDPVNKEVIISKIISKLFGLKSKMYSLVTVDNEEIKKPKAVNKNVVKNKRYKEFVDVLINKGVMRHKMKIIQSKLHRIAAYDICKTSLSSFDDKRQILGDDINNLAYFCQDVKSQPKLIELI